MLMDARVRAWVARMTGHAFLLQLRHVAVKGMSIDERCKGRDGGGDARYQGIGVRRSGAEMDVGRVRSKDELADS